VNGDLINNKKSTVTELRTCIVNVLHQLDVKYYKFNPLRSKLYPSELKTQSVPRSKHSLPRL
jgi:hypothetical protein